MRKDSSTLDWLLQRLEQERVTFDDDEYPLSNDQKRSLDPYYQLLDEDDISLNNGSTQRKLSRIRVRNILLDVLMTPSLGSEVCLLCMLAVTITEFAKVTQRGLLQRLGQWWRHVTHPQGLESASAIAIARIQPFRPVQAYLAHKSQIEGARQFAQTTGPPISASGTSQATTQLTNNGNTAETDQDKEIQYIFSRAPVDLIPQLGELWQHGIQTSNQWDIERKGDEPTTSCLTTLVPRGENEDISITIRVGRREGLRMLDAFKQQPIWTA